MPIKTTRKKTVIVEGDIHMASLLYVFDTSGFSLWLSDPLDEQDKRTTVIRYKYSEKDAIGQHVEDFVKPSIRLLKSRTLVATIYYIGRPMEVKHITTPESFEEEIRKRLPDAVLSTKDEFREAWHEAMTGQTTSWDEFDLNEE